MAALLQEEVAAAIVIYPLAALLEPGIVAIELGAEPRIHAGPAVVPRLVHIDVQYPMVDALGQRPIAPALERPRRALEQYATGERFRVDDGLAIGMRGGGSAAQLDTAQVAGGPELTAYVVRLPAILQKLRRVTPMPVILQPKPQPMRMAGVTQPPNVVIGNLVRHEPPQIPEEAVRLIGTAHQASRQHRQPGPRVVAVALLE